MAKDTPLPELLPLPYRGTFGHPRPPALSELALPPDPMPPRLGVRPLKSWRYVGVFGPELMVCIASVRIGPARESFWAVWDRRNRRLYERTRLGRGGVALARGRAEVSDGAVRIELRLREAAGIETVCRSGEGYAWTRKQGGIEADGRVVIGGRTQHLEAAGVIDDSAGYHERHTTWRWSAGVGLAADARRVAWNLVAGINDPAQDSERTVWLDGDAVEVQAASFAEDLSSVDGLRFAAEARRERNENLVLLRSRYRQPFGTFSGALPGGIRLAEGYGVMEAHDVWW